MKETLVIRRSRDFNVHERGFAEPPRRGQAGMGLQVPSYHAREFQVETGGGAASFQVTAETA
jgi:hypothetical protein